MLLVLLLMIYSLPSPGSAVACEVSPRRNLRRWLEDPGLLPAQYVLQILPSDHADQFTSLQLSLL